MLHSSLEKRAAPYSREEMPDGSRLPVGVWLYDTPAGPPGQPERPEMVPVYHEPAVVPHAVLEEEAAIIKAEGWFHVRGIYLASATDADKARRVEAERRVAERERAARHLCAWCREEIRNGQFTAVVALETVHDCCAREFNAWAANSSQPTVEQPRKASPKAPPATAVPVPLELQLRKSLELGRIQDDESVLWGEWVDEDTPNERYEYEPVRWGDLSVYERHTVERQSDGKLVGGYPL